MRAGWPRTTRLRTFGLPAKLASMTRLEAKFRAGLVAAFSFGFIAATVVFYLLPEAPHGRFSRAVRTEDGFTIIGLLVFAIFCVFSLIALFSAIRASLGLPAISYDGRVLREYVVPFRRIPVSEIEHIEVQSNGVYLQMRNGNKRTVNARLIKDHETFFNRIILD